MKNIVYFLIWLITNSIVAQVVITSEDVLIMNDSIKLPGTLTFDSALKKQPLVIFIHGSGNVDRNGNQGQLAKGNYIKQLSDSLTQKGIAFYRYDKRTSNPDNFKFIMSELVFDKFVEDAVLTIDKFKDDKRFSSITLIGHSQGSLIAMLASKENVTKYISLAGPGEAIDKTIIKQVRTQNGDSLANIVSNHFKELNETGTIVNVDPNLISLFNKPNQPFFASWMKYNPTDEIKKLNIPILILNGNKDLQVKIEDANNLHKANPKSTLVIIENMNHVLKTITKDEDNLKSYSSPDFPLSKELIATIEAFIKK
jgi:pimeloyl-ACP methyl ester carboxylesterase